MREALRKSIYYLPEEMLIYMFIALTLLTSMSIDWEALTSVFIAAFAIQTLYFYVRKRY